MKCSSTRTRERLLERVGRQEGRAEARSRGHVNIAGLRASHRARRRARRGAYFSRIPLDLSHFSSRFFKNSIYRPSLSLSLSVVSRRWCTGDKKSDDNSARYRVTVTQIGDNEITIRY